MAAVVVGKTGSEAGLGCLRAAAAVVVVGRRHC